MRTTQRAPISTESGVKGCARCGTLKPVNEFPLNARMTAGRGSWCWTCKRDYHRAWMLTAKGLESRAKNIERQRRVYVRRRDSDRTVICRRCQRPFLCLAGKVQWVCSDCQATVIRDQRRTKDHLRRRRYANAQHILCPKCGADINGDLVELTVEDVQRLYAARTYCPLCRKKMTDKPGPRQKVLDHIVPLGIGGTHSLTNVRVICASCNNSRPKDGSDVEQEAFWSRPPAS